MATNTCFANGMIRTGHTFEAKFLNYPDMKKLGFAALLAGFFSFYANADTGSCVLYYAKFYLKNGEIFNGCFAYPGEDGAAALDKNKQNEFCNDKGVFRAFKALQQDRKGAVSVYKAVHFVHIRPMYKNQKSDGIFGFAESNKIVKLDSSQIRTMIFWSADNSRSDYFFDIHLIKGTSGMLDTLKTQRYWHRLLYDPELGKNEQDPINENEWVGGPYTGYLFYNYNATVNKAEMRRLIRLKFPKEGLLQQAIDKNERRSRKNKASKPIDIFEYLEKEEGKIKKWFWERRILMVTIQGNC